MADVWNLLFVTNQNEPAWRHLFLWIISYHGYGCRAIGENTALLLHTYALTLSSSQRVRYERVQLMLCRMPTLVGFLKYPDDPLSEVGYI